MVHRHARQSDPGHARRERGGALDRSHNGSALASLCRHVGLRISVHRQRRKLRHGIRRRFRQSPHRLGIGQPKPGEFFRSRGTSAAEWLERAIPVERGGSQSHVVFGRGPVLAGSGRAFGSFYSGHCDGRSRERSRAGHCDDRHSATRPASGVELDRSRSHTPWRRLGRIAQRIWRHELQNPLRASQSHLVDRSDRAG